MMDGNARYSTTAGALLLAASASALGAWSLGGEARAQTTVQALQFKVDPFWPKPFPLIKGPDGNRCARTISRSRPINPRRSFSHPTLAAERFGFSIERAAAS